MRLLRQDLHTLTGVYALDAIDSDKELNRFSRHLNRCQSCAGEVRGFREVTTAMAFAAATDPPPEMRAQVMAAVARTRQLPPEIRTHARPRRTRAWVPWLSGVVAAAAIVVAVLFGRSWIHYRVWHETRRMPLLIGLFLVALFIWFAENIGTVTSTWLYPNQRVAWSMVSLGKLSSWFLLLIISYAMVAAVNRPTPYRRDEAARDAEH